MTPRTKRTMDNDLQKLFGKILDRGAFALYTEPVPQGRQKGDHGGPAAGLFAFNRRMDRKKVAIVMGSASDKPIAMDAVKTLAEYGVPTIVRVLSAHRTPQEARDFTLSLEGEGVGAVIALAGMAAHLAGAVAANTVLPVIGVPVSSGGLGGLDALLSTVQMTSGIPVATVAVGGAKNAAILAVQMLAVSDAALGEYSPARGRRGGAQGDQINERSTQEA